MALGVFLYLFELLLLCGGPNRLQYGFCLTVGIPTLKRKDAKTKLVPLNIYLTYR